jgi:hypothetical protein
MEEGIIGDKLQTQFIICTEKQIMAVKLRRLCSFFIFSFK